MISYYILANSTGLIKIRKAIKLYCEMPNDIVARGMTGYFSDFTEYIIDICETYLVMNDRYNPRLSANELIKLKYKFNNEANV